MKERHVTGNGGTRLRVREWGDPSAPSLVLVHGYPDNSDAWNQVVDRLEDRFHVVTYDVRGAGQSQPGWMYGGYQLDQLVGDLKAVVDATVPRGAKVHLAGHDWGAIQSWEAVLSDKVAPRVASFTFFGAPCLDHAAHWMRKNLRPGSGHPAWAASQVLRSWYIVAFQAPLLAPIAWRLGLAKAWPRIFRFIEGNPIPEEAGYQGVTAQEGARGVWIYRANFVHKLLHPNEGRTDLPVQHIMGGKRDIWVEPHLYEETDERVPNLWRRKFDFGHWPQLTHPDVIAACIAEFAEYVETGELTPALATDRVAAGSSPTETSRRHEEAS